MEIDWFELWRELVNAASQAKSGEPAHRFETRLSKKTERPDPLLDFVLRDIDNQVSLLEVGAGSGRWTIPLARIAKTVTAIEPSDAMLNMLRENIAAASVNNIHILQTSWEEAVVQPHDVIVCAHAMYASPDLAAFVHRMEQHARKRCYLAMRLPPYDGIVGELSLSIYGHPHDSPNAIIAYNALYSMGIYANVLVEDGIYRWVNSTFEEALARAKRHLHLELSTIHDALIRDALARRLHYSNNLYIWPDGMRSALLWWSPPPASKQVV